MNVSGIDAVNFYANTPRTVQAKAAGTGDAVVAENRADTLELSPGGLLLSGLVTPDVERESGSISLNDIGAQIAIDRDRVVEGLKKHMARLGIDKNTDFRLTGTANGHIAVQGDFKGKEALEEAINEDGALRNTYARLSANSSFVEAARHSEEFRKAYEIDPESAVAQFAYLLNNGTGWRFSLEYHNGGITTNVDMVRGQDCFV